MLRMTLRLVASLMVSVTLVVVGFTFYQVAQERAHLEADLDLRAVLLAEQLAGSIGDAPATPDARARATEALDGFVRQRRLAGAAVVGPEDDVLASSRGLDGALPPFLPALRELRRTGGDADDDTSLAGRHVRVHVRLLGRGDRAAAALILFQDVAFIDRRAAEFWRRDSVRLLLYAFIISLVTLLVVRGSLQRPLARLAGWMRDLRAGRLSAPPPMPSADLFAPLTREIESLAKGYRTARAAAEEEARLRDRAESVWTAERLKESCRARLDGRPLLVVSNREPYMHVREGRDVRCIVPASGLVTALEPVLRACGGTWVAHGGGNADRETVDAKDRLRVPPDDPRYLLRRVWLTAAQEDGYYYGFSNEGLWPLCHIAHARPLFRPEDWEAYRTVNDRFAGAILEEIHDATEPCVLIQDYHFALLPRRVKQHRPDARVALFWHIPWPNPEAFGICPWQREILDGMLGADIVGFHTQVHCNNFLETVDRTLEARTDWERFAVNRQSHVTQVKPFPISVAFTGPDPLHRPPSHEDLLRVVSRATGGRPQWLAVGVDRIDYTKGIVERFRAVERFLDKYPSYRGRFALVELGAPSRTRIPRYQDLVREVEAEAARINGRWKVGTWRPIVLVARHHSHGEIEPFYRAADVCLVTSLHDGMNLVAKEFVAARDDEQGVLILSQFAGASRELRDALIVNPYDIAQTAEAIRYALEMEPAEREARMRRLRAGVRERNVYRWAADLIGDLAQVRLEAAPADAPAGRSG